MITQDEKESTDLLIIIPPLGAKNTVYPPYGAMYVASALRQKGYNPKILDVDVERISSSEVINRVKKIDPRYIGFSGRVPTSYKYIKDLSRELKDAFPEKLQILGGGLSSAAEPVIKNTSVDIIVQGEGDITAVELLDVLENGADLESVRGIYYKKGHTCKYTSKRDLIGNLDTLSYPAFDLVNMNSYMPDGIEFIRQFTTKIKGKKIYDVRRKRRMITIPTSRGCFAECSFCFRAYRGLRVHSMKYVFDFIEYCIEKFDTSFFTFGDECFAPNRARNWEFIEEYKKRKLDIAFRILGMRIDTVDKDILKAYKEIGCWMIEYGFESGSQKMLNVIDKRVTVEQNRQVALWTKEAGIFTTPALVLGMPGETSKTIDETIDFLKSLDLNFRQYMWKYAIPIPGSHLYSFAKKVGIIEDEDEYLSSLGGDIGNGSILNINLTEEPDEIVAGWGQKINDELDRNYFYRKYRIKNRLILRWSLFLATIMLSHNRNTLFSAIIKKLKRKSASVQKKGLHFRKKKNIALGKFFKDIDCSVLNREVALKRINERLDEVNVR